MKKLLLLTAFILASLSLQAQIETPAPSPFSKVEQKVGLTDITLEYSRPAMRGRTIFGDLVPYDKLWRTGANANTKITFGDDVTIDGQDVKAGTYSIFTKPGESSWEVFVYAQDEGGLPKEWDESRVAAKTVSQVVSLPMKIESFTIGFDDLESGSAILGMMWENVYVPVKIEVPTEKMVSESIEKTMGGNPKAEDYYTAAVYYLDSDKDIKKAQEWMGKAMEMTDDPAYWQLRQQSLIQAKAGDTKAAIKTAKNSLAKAKEAGNDDYVKLNTDSLKEWGAE
ncbi:Protein of unknown function [Pricia antarctica]|uniref:DUF2911 domain-containing protein n=1 Tax=Pricia antarctica TaxID=641691 RepID=A0A1G7FDF1_9FLAO|nr:DUF2911 domain-containing protein [Pricia antarctica]SDE73565.1 Protein of unknown function [Pricia antarctica]